MQHPKIISILLVFLTACATAIAQDKINYGKGLSFAYDQSQSVFSLSKDGQPFLKDVGVRYQLKHQKETTVTGHIVRTKKEQFSDQAGKGVCYSVISKSSDGLETEQLFFFYEDKPFVVTQLILKGKNLSSNHLVPVDVQGQSLALGSDLRTVFVPFDNDTFISYESRELNATPTASAEVGIVYDRSNHKGLIVASLEQDTWKTGILTTGDQNSLKDLSVINGFTETSIMRDSMEHGYLEGERIASSKILIGYFDDWRSGLESYAKFHRMLTPPYVKSWTEGTPIGWNSWGVIKEKLTYDKAVGTVDFFAHDIPAFRNENGQAFIDLDSFWDNMVPGGMSGDYSKLKEFVAYCKSKGLEPGVYWAPFTDWGHGGGPNRKAEGSTHTFGEMWTKTAKGYHDLDGGRALDPTHPGTRARMQFILSRLVDCGFRMIKIDFLSHAAIESTGFYDANIRTGMQAYDVGMRHLVDLLQDKMLIYAAISPSIATSSYAHMRRIACDAWNTIGHTEYTLNSVTYGWWQTFMYDFIDADHLVFTGENIAVNQARLVSGIVTGTIILGDDFSKKEPWQDILKGYLNDKELLSVVQDGKSFRPIGYADGKRASNLYVKIVDGDTYLAAFNFDKTTKNLSVNLTDIGLKKGKKYLAKYLFSKETATISNQANFSFEQEGVKFIRIKKQ